MPPSKPIPIRAEVLDKMTRTMGHYPDNFIEDATGSSVEGTPQPEDADAQVFFDAVLEAVDPESETSPTENGDGDQGARSGPSEPLS